MKKGDSVKCKLRTIVQIGMNNMAGQLCSCSSLVIYLLICVIANEQGEQRRSACEAVSLMPREVLQQAEKFSIVL